MEEVRNTVQVSQNKKDFVPNLYEITQVKFMEAPLCLTSTGLHCCISIGKEWHNAETAGN